MVFRHHGTKQYFKQSFCIVQWASGKPLVEMRSVCFFFSQGAMPPRPYKASRQQPGCFFSSFFLFFALCRRIQRRLQSGVEVEYPKRPLLHGGEHLHIAEGLIRAVVLQFAAAVADQPADHILRRGVDGHIAPQGRRLGLEHGGSGIEEDPGFSLAIAGLLHQICHGGIAVKGQEGAVSPLEDLEIEGLVNAHLL